MKATLPGGAWVALITLLTGALSGWLAEWIHDPSVPLIILALGLIAKAAEIYLAPPVARFYGAAEPSKLYRLLLG